MTPRADRALCLAVLALVCAAVIGLVSVWSLQEPGPNPGVGLMVFPCLASLALARWHWRSYRSRSRASVDRQPQDPVGCVVALVLFTAALCMIALLGL